MPATMKCCLVMAATNKLMIIAPFWGSPSHVGVYRVDRFIRWLSGAEIEIILVTAGAEDSVVKTTWGTEIMVRDPLMLYRGVSGDNFMPVPSRKPNRLRRMASYILFNPDPTVVWARKAAHNAEVIKHGQDVKWILSSSPPESTHVASYLLARRLNAELIIDMRDGWLDEPLKPLLIKSHVRRWQEGRMERRILERAGRIFVTSKVWKGLLKNRTSSIAERITVLTNAYPDILPLSAKRDSERGSNHLTLLHTGRFTGSRPSQKISHLLSPLFSGITVSSITGKIILLGQLTQEDMIDVDVWKERFESLNWHLDVRKAVPREEMFRMIEKADGLLMLSASNAAVPSKFYEYIPTGKPILAATLRESAVWEMSKNIPQVVGVAYEDSDKNDMIEQIKIFLTWCRQKEIKIKIPEEYTEDYLRNIFLKKIGI